MSAQHTVTEVAEGIYQVRLPLPFALNIVNCYVLRDGDGWTIVDTGIHTADGEATWREAFNILNIKPQHIQRIILTHVHPDHYGMAGWLQQICAEVEHYPMMYLSPREAEWAEQTWVTSEYDESFLQFLLQNGMPTPQAEEVADSMEHTRRMTRPLPLQSATIEAGTRLTIGERSFDVIHAPGHSDGQLIFYDADDRLLLSGDHVLMKITPNIGRWPATDTDPLGRFMDSLHSLRELDVRLALPGHRALIHDWGGRLDELLNHHHERLEHTLDAVCDGATVFEASLRVFSSERFTHHEWRFAVAETLAHLEYLQLRGQVTCDDGDVPRFTAL